jgi:pimeloyl-ACP methyl ester carboxylesterase
MAAQLVGARDGRTLRVKSVGDPAGKPVFLMHDAPGCRDDPCPRDIVLYELGIHLIAYDRPGYGDSDRAAGRTVASAADDVVAIADYFSLNHFSVVGRSGGAPHALACAALLPDRVVCAAALSSRAPYDAEDLDWYEGMAQSSVVEHRQVVSDIQTLVATHNELAERPAQVQAMGDR